MDPSYNGSFNGLNSGGQTTMGGAGGDIILSPSTPPKEHKAWHKIALILGAIIVILVIAIIIVSSIKNKNNSINYQKSQNADLATLVYDGTDEEWEEYYSAEKAYLEDLEGDDNYQKIIDEELELLKMFGVYRDIEKYDTEEIARAYVEEGRNNIGVTVYDKLALLNSSASDYVGEFIEDTKFLVDTTIEYVDIFYDSGCEATNLEDLDKCDLDIQNMKHAIDKKNIIMNADDHREYVIESAINYCNRLIDLTNNHSNGAEENE